MTSEVRNKTKSLDNQVKSGPVKSSTFHALTHFWGENFRDAPELSSQTQHYM